MLGGRSKSLNDQLKEDGFDDDLLAFCDEIEAAGRQAQKKRKLQKEEKLEEKRIDELEDRDAADIEYYRAKLGGDDKKIAKDLVDDGFDEDLFGFLDEIVQSAKSAKASGSSSKTKSKSSKSTTAQDGMRTLGEQDEGDESDEYDEQAELRKELKKKLTNKILKNN